MSSKVRRGPIYRGGMNRDRGDWVWEFDKNQILEGGMLIDTEAGRGKDTLVKEGI